MNDMSFKNVFVFFCFLCLWSTLLTAQQVVSHNRYLVYFTDKSTSAYSINDSALFLSPRALQRRQHQQIQVNETDVPVSQSYMDSITATGAVILQKSNWFNYVCIQISDSAQLTAILQKPFVQSAKLVNRMASGNKQAKLNKFEMEEQLGAQALSASTTASASSLNYGNSYNQIHMLGGEVLHDLNYRGQGMQIAVFDAGFPNVTTLPAFDTLNNDGRLLGYRNVVQNNNTVFAPSMNQHGTNTLSCMAAYKDGQLIGTAPKASYYLFVTEEVNSETPYEEVCWNRAAELADSLGVDIISSSLGYTTFDYAPLSYTHASMNGDIAISTRAADMAASKGILVVNSAGNAGATPWRIMGAPADGDSVLAIGAVDNMGSIASFSSRGNTADGRIKPDVCAQGVATVLAASSGGFFTGNGTSFSGPIIAGMAACLWQYLPNLTNVQLMNLIREYSTQYSNPDSLLGYGIPNFSLAVQQIVSSVLQTDEPLKAVFPTVFQEQLSIIYQTSDTETIRTSIIHSSGKLVAEKSFSTMGHTNNLLTWDNLQLSSGVYTLLIHTSKETLYRKVVCVK